MRLPAWRPIALDDIPVFDKLYQYLQHNSALMPDRLAVANFGGESLTHKELIARVNSMHALIVKSGLEPGGVVATWSHPTIEAWIVFLATVKAGGVWLGLNPKYRPNELAYVLGDSKPSILFAWRSIDGRKFSEAFGAGSESFAGVVRWLDEPAESTNFELADASSPKEPCLLVYTSGTTGQPKGALLTQRGLVTCSRTQCHHYGEAGGKVVNPLPINHVGAICDTGTTTLVAGSAQIFMEHFDPDAIVQAIESEGLTSLGGVPTMLQMVLASPLFKQVDKRSLQRVLWSGAPMPAPIADQLATLGLPMTNFYGMTETTGSITFTAPDAQLDELLETVGYPEDAYEVRIANAGSDGEAKRGGVGEIQVRSPGVFHSYLGRPEATKDAFTEDGWFKTGDLGAVDPAGRITLRGRAKEMFKSGGYNVYPSEVEAAIEAFDEVVAAVVVSRSDPKYFEVGHAFLLLNDAAPVDLSELKDRLSEVLANYKVPKTFEVLTEFPLLPVGKVDRKALKSRAS